MWNSLVVMENKVLKLRKFSMQKQKYKKLLCKTVKSYFGCVGIFFIEGRLQYTKLCDESAGP